MVILTKILWLFKSLQYYFYPALIHFFWFSLVQSLSHVQFFATPWTAECQASLSITKSQSPPKPMSIESVMPSNHLILCRPLLLSSIFPSIRVFSNQSVLHIRWPEYWSTASASVLPMNIQDWSPLGWTGWISLQSKGLSRVFSNTTVQKHPFFDHLSSNKLRRFGFPGDLGSLSDRSRIKSLLREDVINPEL